MGALIVESSRVSTSEEIFSRDGKKKKRRSRKSKFTLSACSSVSEICTDASTSSNYMVSNGHHHMPRECNPCEETIDEYTHNQQSPPHEGTAFSNSVSEPALSFVAVEPVETVLIARPIDYSSRRTYFPPHRSMNSVSTALEKGELVRALFRVNAHNRLEPLNDCLFCRLTACKIDGVQTDVLISGPVAQNRAVSIEGDTVAIVIDPPSLWPRMKGSSETPSSSPSKCDSSHEVLIHAQDCSKGKGKVALDCDYTSSSDDIMCYHESSMLRVMGALIVESSRVSTSEEIFVPSDFKDGKKKKRRSRKSKLTLSACSSVGEMCTDASTSSNFMVSNGHHHMPRECNPCEETIDEYTHNQQSPPHEVMAFSNSVSEPAVSFVAVEPVETVLIARPIDYSSRRTYFPPHRSVNSVRKALEKGELVRALFRVNAHNRLEAYCKIDGVQTDVLISGPVAQNRAIEGDTVAIVIDPPSMWPRMKGSSETLSSSPSKCDSSHEVLIHAQDCSKGKGKVALDCDYASSSDDIMCYHESSSGGVTSDNGHANAVLDYNNNNNYCNNGYQQNFEDSHGSMSLLAKLSSLISLYPSKRPTGKVVAIIEKSARRENVVGFLSIKQWLASRETRKKNSRKNNKSHTVDLNSGFLLLTSTDPRFTKMMVPVRSLPESLKNRLEAGDLSIESDLVAAKIVDWAEERYIPDACVTQVFGRGSDVEAQIAAILFENEIDSSEFSPEVLSCLPGIPWEVPKKEFETRRDLRSLCVFTIDPASATDLDDALSAEKLPEGIFRVGVHIADASYFVLPDTALDIDAQIRSTSVYLLRRKLPMLPPELSDNLASLHPGVDRLAFSIFWDINRSGEVLDRWIGRTIIRSCCKLSYEHAQDIIDGSFNFPADHWPELHSPFQWREVITSLKSLHDISTVLRENRFKSGALSLESPKVIFLYDENGIPYDSVVSGRTGSNFLVEELMLLANRTAAEVITRTYPSSALLRRHPEPNPRKLREFETFCSKHGLKLDISSSGSFHRSLELIRGELKNDSVFFDILMSYAARPMQLATYFCSGDLKDTSDFGHYALAVPLYTHFTSPLRRYPDIVVHRTLAAALEAEDFYLKRKIMAGNEAEKVNRCFSGVYFEKDEIESVEAREALSLAAVKYRVPEAETLADVATRCNERKLATRHVKDATDKLYIWVLLKNKEILYSEARVLGLGPKFMSLYIPKLAMERRIYYDDVDGLTAEWLDATSTLLLSQSTAQKRSTRKNSPGKSRSIEEIALIVSPTELSPETTNSGEKSGLQNFGPGQVENEPAFFPLTVHLLSTIPIALHAVGGDDGPIDIIARLYMCSYFH
ncbi:DIS3-like exonuclease 2 [Striga asiatica]|uniref:DIS3-like exonuclease 2 n=1 Tax=Striga asiatica TaxID=4170 RepID=A0A5A7Q0T9_STRAF|nr:DIS3-like exonuclease 2 [Striga asiatica]